jgi:DNA-3-methyladenine glycosylase II
MADASLQSALAELAGRDADMARAYALLGLPPKRAGRAGFAALIGTICSQQMSTASSRAIMGRLNESVKKLEPRAFLALGDGALRKIGFSRQKIAYCRILANAVTSGQLSFRALESLSDEAVVDELTKLKGIGLWTAEIYLLFALKRPDVWPVGDLALGLAVQRLKGLKTRPDAKKMLKIGEPWRPYRSAASRFLWHYYAKAPKDA